MNELVGLCGGGGYGPPLQSAVPVPDLVKFGLTGQFQTNYMEGQGSVTIK